MIQPTKYMALEESVINVSAEILSELFQTKVIALNDLDGLIRARLGESARFNFLSAVNLLYLTGKLDYDEDTDAVISTIFRKTY